MRSASATTARGHLAGVAAAGRERRRSSTSSSDTPGTSVGYCMARNRPAWARSHVSRASTSTPSRVTEPPVHLVAGPAHDHVGERRLARAVGAHHRVDLAAAHDEVDPAGGSPCRRRRPAGPRCTAQLARRLAHAITTNTSSPSTRTSYTGTGRVAGSDVGLAGRSSEKQLPCFQHSIWRVVGVDLALGQRDVLVGADVADGVHSRRRCARRRRGGRRRRSAGPRRRAASATEQMRCLGHRHGRSPCAVELARRCAARPSATSAGHRAAGATTSSKKPATISRSATWWAARRGSRGRSAAPRRPGRRWRRGCSARRCSRSRGWAPTRPRRGRRA